MAGQQYIFFIFARIYRCLQAKYSKQKRTELIRIVQEIIKKLRETGVFNKELKTIATKEACFLYDILVCSDIIKLDPYFNGQEKYQFIKRFLKE